MKTPEPPTDPTPKPNPLGAHRAAALNLELLERALARTGRNINQLELELARLRARRDRQEKERARQNHEAAKGPRA
jgi:hypothetical protein